MRKRTAQNSRPKKEDFQIELIAENLVEFEHLVHKRQMCLSRFTFYLVSSNDYLLLEKAFCFTKSETMALAL